MRRCGRFAGWAVILAAIAGCGGGEEPALEPPDEPPLIEAVTVEGGPQNVISAVVRATVSGADSVAVRFGPTGGDLSGRAPAVRPSGNLLALPVLGLHPATAYDFVVEAWAGDTSARSAPVPLTTDPLPPDLPSFVAAGTDTLPGYVAFALGTWAIVIDNAGRVVWYRRLAAPTLNFQPLPTGGYATHPITADSADTAPWLELDALGNVVRRHGCGDGLRSRFHDLIAEPDGSRWVLCDETRTMDLSASGGSPTARVTATVVQHVGANGAVLFRWNSFDHFAITDLDPALRAGPTVNFTHANALDFTDDGRLVLSFRSLNEVTCVDTATGDVRWRMGGLANQFAFDDPGLPYVRQHGLRALPGNRFVVLDNLGEQAGSRGELYAYDVQARRATRLTVMPASPPAVAVLGGAVQLLPRGHVLVAFGDGFRVQEFDALGNLTWGIVGDAGYIYRATRIASLYEPGVELER